mgnify:CR=1 FL=1
MATHGKRYLAAAATVDRSKTYNSAEACAAVKAAAKAKFNETVDVAVRLGVDPRHADQVVRGTVVLPHGTGKTVRVLVVTQGEKAKEAEAAGADFVGLEFLQKLKDGWLECDVIVATPDVMGQLGQLGRVLGPRGLNVHVPIGKASFSEAQLAENLQAFMDTIMRAKPAAAKGVYIRSATVSSTMGPGVRLETAGYK